MGEQERRVSRSTDQGRCVVIALVADKLKEIEALCQKHRIARLDLFGSAATGTFDPATSDLDFLVDLGEYDASVLDRYLGLANDLEALFGHEVDLVTVKSLKNPYFIAALNHTKAMLYEAGDREAAA